MIKLVSSANKTILLLLSVREGRLFMYRRKSKGPSIDPWGTPWVVLPHSEIEYEYLLFETTLWYLIFRKVFINLKNPPVTP